MINIKDFGAKGDGSSNDAVAFQKAQKAAPNQTIYFPAGNYNLTGMSPARGNCRIRGDHDAVVQGFNWTELSMPRMDSRSSTPNDSYFSAYGIKFQGTATTPALTLKNQSQPHVIRSASISQCAFYGHTGLVMENCQGVMIDNCDFVQNVYGAKSLSSTNNIFSNCNWYSPVIGVDVATAPSDSAGRLGGENLKFVGCKWIAGVTAIQAVNHNYLWLSACLIDYFNLGVFLQGSKFTKIDGSYIGYHNQDKRSVPGYVAPPEFGALYGTGDGTHSRSSGIVSTNTEYLAYAPASKAPVRFMGNTTGFVGCEEILFTGCRFASMGGSANTMSELLLINTAYDVCVAESFFFAPMGAAPHGSITQPYVLHNAARTIVRDNLTANVF
jgi:hypothetical protein